MKISTLKIKGFRSFGPTEISIYLNQKLSAFIGVNSSGKTTSLEALKKLFGSSITDREVVFQDFHCGKDEKELVKKNKELSIEVRLEFSEKEQEAIPHFFSSLVIDGEEGSPYLRLRLESTWEYSEIEPDGIIDTKFYIIKTAEGETVDDDSKILYSNHLRPLIQILYVPAIRRPAEQLKYASGSILYRVLKKIKWDDKFKSEFDQKIEEINSAFKGLPEFDSVHKSINTFWKKFHKDIRYKETELGFGTSDFESVLKKLEISFTPTPNNRKFQIDDLGEGYRSLFYLTLVCSLLEIEEALLEDEEKIGITKPLLTIVAVEEPENHIAPQLLGRVIKILTTIGGKEASQVLISSHTPAIVKRLDPKCISHFRINNDFETEVNSITLPEKEDEAYKYIKEAIYNYPEIYFAKLVVIGEGDSEQVIFNRLMNVLDVDFDDNVITFAPLGHRFVNHIWKLLHKLHIPWVTLLDLDIEREGGAWGRVKYVLNQLILIGLDKNKLLALEGGKVLSDKELAGMHTWSCHKKEDRKNLNDWVNSLKKYNVYYSQPLDLDFLMLEHYTEDYKNAIPTNGGPKIPDKITENESFNNKVNSAVQATLKSDKAIGDSYSDAEKELMIWYNYHFLGRGKPTTHINVLAEMTDEHLKKNLPPIFSEVFKKISKLIK